MTEMNRSAEYLTLVEAAMRRVEKLVGTLPAIAGLRIIPAPLIGAGAPTEMRTMLWHNTPVWSAAYRDGVLLRHGWIVEDLESVIPADPDAVVMEGE